MNPPNNLKYCRSLSPSKAVFFYQTDNSDFEPLQIERTKISGQRSDFSAAYDKNNKPKPVAPQDLAFANPQTIDTCYVPPTLSELSCRFSFRVEANSLEPMVCSDSKVNYWLKRFSRVYCEMNGYEELAQRYAKNLLSAQWLWRNKKSPYIEVEVLESGGESVNVKNAERLHLESDWGIHRDALDQVVIWILRGLTDKNSFCYFDITARITPSFCQEIYPSQLFVDHDQKSDVSKQLATMSCLDGRSSACITAQKVGAAIQTIDNWYGNEYRPLRVHEYGADKQALLAKRSPHTGADFYSSIRRIALVVRDLERNGLAEQSEYSNDAHFIAAILVKGGLFQGGKS